MIKQILPLAILTATFGFAEVPAPRSILTTCAPGPKQARCVLQEFTATEPRVTAKVSTVAAVPGPFQQEFDLKIYDGSNAVVGRIDIHAGMQVVVESVSTYATVPVGQAPRVSVSTTVRGADGTYFNDTTLLNVFVTRA